jgi:hypothetical protein
MLLTLELWPGQGLGDFSLGGGSPAPNMPPSFELLAEWLDPGCLVLFPVLRCVPTRRGWCQLPGHGSCLVTCDLCCPAGMPLHDAVILIRKKRSELSCVEVKYADQVPGPHPLGQPRHRTWLSCTVAGSTLKTNTPVRP